MFASEQHNSLSQWIKAEVLQVLPDAQVILYGSRARGEARPDSDWDFLVLTDEPVTSAREREVWHRVYPVEVETGAVINVAVKNRHAWRSRRMRVTPFHQAVTHEGIVV